VGLGWIAQQAMLPGFRNARNSKLVALVSSDRTKLSELSKRYTGTRSYTYDQFDECLASEEVDAVYIALPNALHHEWTMRALAAGKHVICEKPYTRHAAEVKEAWDAARGLVLTEAYMWRHSAQTRLLLELLPEVGEVRSVHSTFAARLSRPDDPRWVRRLGGGALLDVGCYCVSAARLVLGEPDAVHGEARLRGEVDAGFAGTLRFGDVTATFQCALDATLLDTIEVVGTSGFLRVPHAFVRPPGVVVLNGEEHRVEPGDPYRAELDDFCAAIRGERPALVGYDEMLGQARALEALLRSAVTASSPG
jgi:xylose dehydrogenase (NAD/NADP)